MLLFMSHLCFLYYFNSFMLQNMLINKIINDVEEIEQQRKCVNVNYSHMCGFPETILLIVT